MNKKVIGIIVDVTFYILATVSFFASIIVYNKTDGSPISALFVLFLLVLLVVYPIVDYKLRR